MTPQARVEVLQMYDVARATVGDLIKTFKQMGRQHALVVEEIDGKQTIRGILSTTQIAKQTGIRVDTSEYAGSFAVIQASDGCAPSGRAPEKPGPGSSVFQNEGHFQVDPVLGNLAVLDRDLLILYPGAHNVFQGLGCALDSTVDGILETLVGRSNNFCHFCH
jgi:hypothetical protein